jgi:hypothetical protein
MRSFCFWRKFTQTDSNDVCVFAIFRDDADRRPVLDTTVSALHRATGPSLGSVCVSALIVAVLRIAGQLAARARRVSGVVDTFAAYR